MSSRNLLLSYWNTFIDRFIRWKQLFLVFLDNIVRKFFKAPDILSPKETLERILSDRCSISRFGDGEIKLASGRSLGFQPYSKELGDVLREVLSSSSPKLMVCLPDIFGDLSKFTESTRTHWLQHLSVYRRKWLRCLGKERRTYGNAFISRCYLMYRDKSGAGNLFSLFKTIWEGRDVLLIEGERSRLGVGNDLFATAASIKRILAPNTDAFSFRYQIIDKVRQFDSSQYLVLLALGPTATVLAYDLAKEGYQALDIGHIDIEYEWYKMGALTKVPVHGKYVNEAGGKPKDRIHDKQYKSEIICRFSA